MTDEEIVVKARLEDALTRPVDRATRAIDDLGDEAQQTALQLQILDAAERQAAGGADSLSRSVGRSREEVESSTTSQKKNTKQTDEQTGAYDRLNKVFGKIKKVGKGFDLGKLMGLYKVPALVTGLNVVGGAISALGGAAYAGIAGLAPLVGLLVALPATMAAAAQAMGAVKLGLFGVSDAAAALASGDAEKIAETMAALTPQGRELARTLADFTKGPLASFREGMQRNLAPGFTDALERVPAILKAIQPEMEGTARTIGTLADQAAKAAASPMFSKRLGAVMKTNNVALANGGKAGIVLAKAGLGILYAFRPVLRVMSEYALRAAEFINKSVQAGIASGELTAFFKRAWRLGKDVGAVIRDLSVALFNIGKESGALGKSMGGGIMTAVASLRAWTESAQGQSSIRKYFTALIPVIQQIAGLIGDVAKLFGSVSTSADLAPLLMQIRSELLPAIADLAGGVSKAFGPALISAATAFVQFNNALTFSPLAVVLQGIADAVSFLSTTVSSLPAPLNTVFASLMVASLGFKAGAAGVGMMGSAFSPLISGAKSVASGLSDTTETTGLLGKAVSGARSQMTLFRLGMTETTAAGAATGGTFSKMGFAAKSMGGKLMGMKFVGPMLSGIGTAARFMWAGITGPIGLAILAIAAVIAIGVLLYKKWEPFRKLVDAVWGAIKDGASAAWNWIKSAWVDTLMPALTSAWSAVSAAFSAVVSAISTGLRAVWAVASPVIGFLVSAFKMWWSVVSTIIGIYLTVWKTAFQIVWWVVKAAFAIIAVAFIALWTLIKPIVMLIGSIFRVVFQAILAVARSVMSAVAGAVRAMWGAVKAIWGAIKPFVLPIWTAIRAAVSAAMNGIRAGVSAGVSAVKTAWGTVTGAVKAVWSAVSGAVSSAMGKVSGVIKAGVKKIQGFWGGLKSFIEGMWGGVSGALSSALSGVSGVINSVIGKVNGLIGAFNKLPGPDISKIPYLFAGGPTTPGMKAVVGEIGPEAWVRASGAVEIIGQHGPEVRTFPASGYVLPNSALQAASAHTDESLPSSLLSALEGRTEQRRPIPRAESRERREPPQMHVVVHAGSDVDVKTAIKDAWRELMAEEERVIHHGGWED